MQFILLNCSPKLKAMDIDPSVEGWQEQLTAKLSSYVTVNSWGYSYDTDTLFIDPVQGTYVSTNLTDFGDAGGLEL